nr:hypothetical protein [Tanacetum cinerariifolium]
MIDPDPVPLGPNLPPRLKGNVSNRMGKGNKSVAGMNEDESDGEESRDEGADGEMTSNAFFDTQNLMSSLGNSSVKGNSTSKGVNMNNCMNTNDEIGPIPVPVSENPLLNSKNNLVSPRILKRGNLLLMGGIRDEAMKEVPVGMKHVSFINVVQGVNKSGSNKLRLISVCMNDQSKRVVDMDPLIKKGRGYGELISWMRNEDTSGGMYRQMNYYGKGSTSRGGFNSRGRGGMNGRGFGDQRFTRNNGAHYVFKKNGAAGPVSERETNKTEKGNLKVDECKFPRDNGIDSGVAYRKVYDEVYRDRHDRIEEMIMKKQLAKVELFFKTEQVLSIVEVETWSEEKLGFSKNSIVRSLLDNKLLYVSVIYGEITLKSRSEGTQDFRECVDCLGVADINMNGLFYTWIQKMKNPELGVLKKLDKIMGNSQFISSYPASYAAFMPYLSSDHCPCILTHPELAKRLNFMKKHIRDLNRKNRDIFYKANFLRTELGRVQECLDRDPSNVALREEEMVYAYAFKDVALDEEKVLQQKTKITWLKDGDFNSSYFHKVVKGRISQNRIKVVYVDKDAVYEVKDADSLLTKRLDDDVALDMIKPVDEKEIKEALFSIDDNKTSGPDGYSSKFFKAAWSVVRPDLCSTTNEFFC